MQYFVISTVRKVQTRVNRMRAASRPRLRQTLCGGRVRLIRGRPQPIVPELLRDHYDELHAAQREGILQIREGSRNGPVHVFGKDLLAWKAECHRLEAEHAQKRAALHQEGKVEEARALALVLPDPPEEWGDAAEPEEDAPAAPEPASESGDREEDEEAAEEAVPDAEDEPTPDVDPEPAEEPESYEPDKPVERMNKAELIAHVCRVTGKDPADIEDLTKKQLMGLLS